MNSAQIWSIILSITAVFLVGFAQQPKLIYVQEVFRHGARYPIYPSSSDNSAYATTEKSEGELTKQGKSMHYVLGQYLYNEYYSRLFGVDNIYNQSKFYVKSTDVNRTIESAQSQLLGIFENINKLNLAEDDISYSLPQWPGTIRQAGYVYTNSPQFNPVPIHVEKGPMNPWDNGDFLRTYSPEFCYNQKSWIESNKQNAFIKDILANDNFTRALKSLNTQLKANISFWEVYKYYDNAQCMLYQRKNGILPIFTENSDNRRALEAMYVLDAYMKMFYTEQQLKTSSTGYFNETVNHFKRVTNNQNGVQWSFYSAHDTTIANYLARLGLTSVMCIYQSYLSGNMKNTNSCISEYPKYTSNLIFEVYQYKQGANVFKIRYNGQFYQIPFCGNKTECPVETFYSWYNGWKDESYVKTCGVVDNIQGNYLTIIFIFIGIIVLILIAGVVRHLNKKRKARAQTNIKRSDQEFDKRRGTDPPSAKTQKNVLQESLMSQERQ